MLLADFAKEFHVADILAPGGIGVNKNEGESRDIEDGFQENAVEDQGERTGRTQSSSVSSLLQVLNTVLPRYWTYHSRND